MKSKKTKTSNTKRAEVSKGNTMALLIQSRNWCFTDFEDIDFSTVYTEYSDIIRYICWGQETCPKTGKLHQQGWVQFVNKKRMGGVKKILGSKKIHVETCRGSEEANDKYCRKENKYETRGKYIKMGERTDLEIVKKMIDNGCKMKEVADAQFGSFVRYHTGFTKYKEMVDEERASEFRQVKTSIYWGATGTGKTRLAMENDDVYKITGDSLEWWDGYSGQKTLVIDEYSNQVKITKMLNILDGYKLRLPIKGGFTYANWTRVIITTNLGPSELHTHANEEHVNAFKRRISEWREFLP